MTAYWAQFLSKGIKILLVARRDLTQCCECANTSKLMQINGSHGALSKNISFPQFRRSLFMHQAKENDSGRKYDGE